jgi:hypothetical protein
LDPLISLTSSKVKFEWHSSDQQAFDKIKKVIGTEVLLFYPDFNKSDTFHLYTTERELLSAIETCKAGRNTRLSYYVTIIPSKSLQTIRIISSIVKSSDWKFLWLVVIEEFGVTFDYIPGKKKKNVVGDAFSLLDIDSLKIQEEEVLTLFSVSENHSISNIKFPMHTALMLR